MLYRLSYPGSGSADNTEGFVELPHVNPTRTLKDRTANPRQVERGLLVEE